MTEHPLTIRPFTADEWPTWRGLRLLALADSPDAFGATLADAQARTDDTWQALLAQTVASSDRMPLFASVDGQPAGLAWGQYAADTGVATVYQVWVAPRHRGRGIARALVARLVGWARERGATAVELDVTVGDTPAVRLYRRMGFQETAGPVPMAGRNGLQEQAMRLPLD